MPENQAAIRQGTGAMATLLRTRRLPQQRLEFHQGTTHAQQVTGNLHPLATIVHVEVFVTVKERRGAGQLSPLARAIVQHDGGHVEEKGRDDLMMTRDNLRTV